MKCRLNFVCVCAVLSACWPILIVRIQWLIKEHQEVRELQKEDLDRICRFIYTHTVLVYKCTQSKHIYTELVFE